MFHSHISNKNFVGTSIALRCIWAIIIFVMMGVGISSFSSNAQAQDSGWEFNVGAGYASYMLIYNPGGALLVSGGYRFTDWFSLNLEQSVYMLSGGNMFDHYDEDADYCVLGDTTLTTKFIWLNDARNFELYFKIGAGIIYPGDEDFPVLWSFPVGVGGNYYFTENLGLGMDIQYNLEFWWTGMFKAGVHLAMRF